MRYVDFDAGDDAKDGATQMTAWKHHPWDAKSNRRGQGRKWHPDVRFQAAASRLSPEPLKASESGRSGQSYPPDSSKDPDWGKGEAAIYGSTQIRGGWKQAKLPRKLPEIPQPDKVWYIDLGKDYDPDPDSAKFSAMWQVSGDKVDRLHIAREPNYDFSDPNNPVKNWPTWSAYDPKTQTLTSPTLKGLGDKDLFCNATVSDRAGFSDGGRHRTLDGRLDLQSRDRLRSRAKI